MKVTVIPSLLFCIVLGTLTFLNVSTFSSAQGEIYHDWLHEQLTTRHGLVGGEWIVFDNEPDLFNNMTVDVKNHRHVVVQDQPFSRAIEIKIDEMPEFLWSEGMWINTQIPVVEGDTVLLTFWTRAHSAQVGAGMVSVAFEEKATWQKSLHWSAEPAFEWKQHYLPFTVKHTNDAGKAHISFQFGAQLQTVEIGGIAAVNYGQSADIFDLPIDFINTYDGREPNADWRESASERIAHHRMGDLDVNVVDQNGEPVPGVQIEVQMQRHAFEWGTAVKTHQINGDSSGAETYREKLLDLDGNGRGFNLAVPENALKWTNWEQNSGWWIQDETIEAIEWLDANGLDVHGHNAIWGNWAHLPDDLRVKQDDSEYSGNRVYGRINEVLTDPRLSAINSWDILNEGRDTDVLPAIFSQDERYPTGKEQYADWFAFADKIAPEKRHFVNDFSILSNGGLMVSSQVGYQHMIGELLAAESGVDAIGMQAHIFYPLASPERVYTILSEFAAPFGLPLRITEFDVAVWDEALAADYLRDFVTIIYSHPAVESFVMWDFYDETHWLNNAPLYRADWTLKPSGQAFIDLVFDQWWTDELGYADYEGYYRTRAFVGDYLVTATTVEGDTQTLPVTLDNEGKPLTLILTLKD